MPHPRTRPLAASSLAGALALASSLALSGCSRGPLPDLGFGSQSSSEASEGSEDSPSSSSSSPGSGSSGAPNPSGSSSEWGEEDEGEAAGSGEASSEATSATSATDATTDPATSDASEVSGDPSGDPSEGEEWGEEWGIPPDVTNEPCDALAQDCFPTHKCVPFASEPGSGFWDANKCMPILGEKTWGEPCTMSNPNEAQDDCDGEGFCWNLEWVEGQLHGICVPFCVGSPQDLMCPSGWGCLFTGAIALCSKQCSPLLQDCPEAYGCYWTGGTFDCQINGTPAQAGEACDMNNDCLPGLACVDKPAVPNCQGEDANCCTPWCDLDAPDPCAPPLACVPFFEQGQAPESFANVGVCITPDP